MSDTIAKNYYNRPLKPFSALTAHYLNHIYIYIHVHIEFYNIQNLERIVRERWKSRDSRGKFAVFIIITFFCIVVPVELFLSVDISGILFCCTREFSQNIIIVFELYTYVEVFTIYVTNRCQFWAFRCTYHISTYICANWFYHFT